MSLQKLWFLNNRITQINIICFFHSVTYKDSHIVLKECLNVFNTQIL